MNMKFYGAVGYSSNSYDPDTGISGEVVTEKSYYGDVLQNSRRYEGSDVINQNLTLENKFSILADEHAFQHFHDIKYVRWAGGVWQVTKVDVQRPRLILTVGGVYNGPTN